MSCGGPSVFSWGRSGSDLQAVTPVVTCNEAKARGARLPGRTLRDASNLMFPVVRPLALPVVLVELSVEKWRVWRVWGWWGTRG
eukprot:gene9513-biopygen7693